MRTATATSPPAGPGSSDVDPAARETFVVRPSYEEAVVDHWLPALGRPVDRLSYGGKVADVGCGHGAASVLVAKRFPLVSVHGFDFHGPSIETARAAARDAGVGTRCTFTECPADDVPAGNYDLLLLLGCLHEMTDPLAVARRARKVVAPDGVVMVIDPIADDRLADDGAALGAQTGPAKLTQLLLDAGFGEVDIVATTAFNHVLAARPPG